MSRGPLSLAAACTRLENCGQGRPAADSPATSVIASIRGERDIAVGNVVGSNIFNILGVFGIGGLFASGGIAVSETAIAVDIPVMIAVAAICLPLFFTGSRISRWEGVLLLGYYAAYTVYLILSATRNVRLSVFADSMLYVVIPATLLVVGDDGCAVVTAACNRVGARGGREKA